jgi:hypothetical protein
MCYKILLCNYFLVINNIHKHFLIRNLQFIIYNS